MFILENYFERFPSQMKVASKLLSYGMSVKDGKAYCGDIEQSDSAIARACNVDRRVVKSTLEYISSTPKLKSLFSKLSPMLSMVDMASEIGCSSITIVPTDSKVPGILVDVTAVLYRNGVNIKQVTIEDIEDLNRALLHIVVEGKIDSEIIPQLRASRGVASIIIK